MRSHSGIAPGARPASVAGACEVIRVAATVARATAGAHPRAAVLTPEALIALAEPQRSWAGPAWLSQVDQVSWAGPARLSRVGQVSRARLARPTRVGQVSWPSPAWPARPADPEFIRCLTALE